MIPAGYLLKRVAVRPEWLRDAAIDDVYSLSNCISVAFADYIRYWRHNGYWLFDSPAIVETLAAEERIDLAGSTLFYYEVYPAEFDEATKSWSAFGPEPSFVTAVQLPAHKALQGFDVTCFSARTSPECSPLSCNSLAAGIPVNVHCLFNTFAEAKAALENGCFNHSEPGPFRIFAVYTVEQGGGTAA